MPSRRVTLTALSLMRGSSSWGDYFTYWASSNASPEAFDGTVSGFFYRTESRRSESKQTLALTFVSVDAPKDAAAFGSDLTASCVYVERQIQAAAEIQPGVSAYTWDISRPELAPTSLVTLEDR